MKGLPTSQDLVKFSAFVGHPVNVCPKELNAWCQRGPVSQQHVVSGVGFKTLQRVKGILQRGMSEARTSESRSYER